MLVPGKISGYGRKISYPQQAWTYKVGARLIFFRHWAPGSTLFIILMFAFSMCHDGFSDNHNQTSTGC